MQNVIVLTDVHIHNYKQYNQGTSRLDNTLSVLHIVFKYAIKHNINYILFAGDLYDNQKLLPTSAVNALISLLLQYCQEAPEITFIAISGNHDQATKNLLESPAVTALTHLQDACLNFKLIDNASYIIGGVAIHGIPYYEYKEHYQEKLKYSAGKKIKNKKNYILIHQTPSGIGNDAIPIDTDINDLLYENFEYVFCGHIHKRIQLSEKFLLVGSPLHRDRSDEGEDKGFIVMDLEAPENGYKFVSLNSKFPVFRTKFYGETLKKGEEKDFINWLPTSSNLLEGSTEIEPSKFRTDISPDKLMENYCDELGIDKATLKTGLKFI